MSFNLWIELPKPWTRSAFVGHLGATKIGVVASDAFTVGSEPAEAVRICLGGPLSRSQIRSALDYMAHALTESPDVALTFL